MKIFFSAGEPSGDQHAAHLIQELRSRNSQIEYEGFGGPQMQAEGCQLLTLNPSSVTRAAPIRTLADKLIPTFRGPDMACLTLDALALSALKSRS